MYKVYIYVNKCVTWIYLIVCKIVHQGAVNNYSWWGGGVKYFVMVKHFTAPLKHAENVCDPIKYAKKIRVTPYVA